MFEANDVETQQILATVTPGSETPQVETRFWRKLLYTFNIITMLASITLMAVGIYLLNASEVEMSAPKWAVQCLIAFGATMCVISVVGLIGTYRSPEYIVQDKCNFMMFFYQLMVLLSFVVTLVAAVTFLTLLTVLDGVKSDTPQGSAKTLDTQIRSWMEKERFGKWQQLQNYLGCCGYTGVNADSALETGKPCSLIPKAGPCKLKVISEIESKSMLAGILAVVVAFIQLLTLLASCCIIWTKPKNSGAFIPSEGAL